MAKDFCGHWILVCNKVIKSPGGFIQALLLLVQKVYGLIVNKHFQMFRWIKLILSVWWSSFGFQNIESEHVLFRKLTFGAMQVGQSDAEGPEKYLWLKQDGLHFCKIVNFNLKHLKLVTVTSSVETLQENAAGKTRERRRNVALPKTILLWKSKRNIVKLFQMRRTEGKLFC